MPKCKHGLSQCKFCLAPEALKVAAPSFVDDRPTRIMPPQIAHMEVVSRFDDRGMRSRTDSERKPKLVAPKLDNVSDRRTKNTPKPHNALDVIDRACFTFRKNTRAK